MTRDLKKWEFENTIITLYKTQKNEYGVEYIRMVTPKEYAENNKDDFFVKNCPEFYLENTKKTVTETDCRLYGSRNAAMNRIRKLLKSNLSK